MAGSNTTTKDGGWVVELTQPIKDRGRMVTKIAMRKPTFGDVFRLTQGEIESTTAMAALLAGVPEATLMKLTYPDIDNVFVGMMHLLPPAVRDTMSERPLVTGQKKAAPPPAEPSSDEAPATSATMPAEYTPLETETTDQPAEKPLSPEEMSLVNPVVGDEFDPPLDDLPPGFIGAHDPVDPRFPHAVDIENKVPLKDNPEIPVRAAGPQREQSEDLDLGTDQIVKPVTVPPKLKVG